MADTLAILRQVYDPDGAGAGMEDGQLVERFVHAREQAAFAALLRRHGPMVLGVCRRLLSNVHDAEDAFQATFLVLAQQAGSLNNPSHVGSWLCRVASHAAVRARARDARRCARERTLAQAARAEARKEDQEELWQALHDELRRLPDKLQVPLVLCYLEGQSYEEAARQLGWPLGTLKKRLAQGRALLRQRLMRRGLAPAAGLLALRPSRLEAEVPDAFLRLPAAAAPSARTLAEEIMRTMLRVRFPLGAALTLAALLLAGVAGLLARPATPAAAGALANKKVGGNAAPAPGPSQPPRVLLAASAATREFQFVRSLLERRAENKQVKLTVHLQSHGGRVPPGYLDRLPDLLRPEGYPGTREADRPYNLARYDLIIAFDLDWAKARPETLVLLQSWVEKRGGGLILVAGPAHTAALGKETARAQGLGPILELSPVVPADGPRKGTTDQPRRLHFAKGAPDLLFLRLDEGRKKPQAGWDAFFGGKDAEPERGFFDCQPVKTVQPGARVVLTYPDPKKKPAREVPYLVVVSRGQGRVVWLGSGEMWRLRQYQEAYHERFWLGLARYAGPGSKERASP